MRAYLIIIIVIFFVSACTKNDVQKENTEDEEDFWLIPRDEVLNSFENRDGIVSIDTPIFTIADKVDFLHETDLVFSVKENNVVKVYPVKILQGHEIVNDSIGDIYFSVTYCPLTKSGICINRKINAKVTEFGVSGMLYNDNLMPYDRNTESIWSQMLGKCVNGELVERQFETLMMITTNWQTIKSAYPEALVLTDDNFYNCDCGLYKLGFKSNGFGDGESSDNTDGFLPGGYFYGIVKNGIVKSFKVELYSYESLNSQLSGITQSNILIGSGSYDYISAFKRNTLASFSIVRDSLPIILSDSEGNKWDMFGYALEGPKKGQRLGTLYSYSASLWAWEEFYQVEKVVEF